MKKTAQYIISARFATHLLMLAFAGASLGNIKDFFITLHTGEQVAWGVGVALGGALVIMATLLSEMTWNTKNGQFRMVGFVTLALCLISGSIQSWAYSQHMNSGAAIGLGFALPLVGELGLSFALSAYNKAMSNRRVEEAQNKLANGVRDLISQAVEAIDKDKVQAQIDKATGVIVRAVVNDVVSGMIAELQSDDTNAQNNATEQSYQSRGTTPDNDTKDDTEEMETMRRIVRYYIDNPGVSYQEAADSMQLEKMFLHRRVKRLVKEDVLHEEKQGKRSIITVNGRHQEFLAGSPL